MKNLAFALAALLLAACSTNPQLPSETSWHDRQQELSDLNHWFVSGRVAIKNGVESWHVNLLWLQQADEYRIRLHGPFGAGQVQLKGDSYQAVLSNSDDQHYTASDVDQLLYDRTGVKMPVSELRYWMLGLPAPNAKNKTQLDKTGRLKSLQQSDWNVHYRRYDVVKGLVLPTKIFARKHDLDVRVVIDKWELGLPSEDNPFMEEG
ncbi:MAG: lipoprotein insertase outer membrane protein LolB [Gammaproteobacteria bacterium]|nr:lipoprotein insertase outer membrane protein LolB [Gammaproteobacteria bacterium]